MSCAQSQVSRLSRTFASQSPRTCEAHAHQPALQDPAFTQPDADVHLLGCKRQELTSVFCWMGCTVNEHDGTGVAAYVIFIGIFQYSVVELERFVAVAIGVYYKGGHWIALKDSKLWCEERYHVLLEDALQSTNGLVAFGGTTKRSSTIVASSPACKKMRWTCTQRESQHKHYCAEQSWPVASVHLLVFSCTHSVDGALGPPVYITAERLPRLLPCHVLSDVFAQSPEDHNGKVIVCKTQHELHHCSTLHHIAPRPPVCCCPVRAGPPGASSCHTSLPEFPQVGHGISQERRWFAVGCPDLQKVSD